ncbi:MAG TPA: SulP family inorganic anion transporter [Gemmatimonadales bacterium]|nr:SulP family inorganic anion transporter [Gemmatimonadales bacterium]
MLTPKLVTTLRTYTFQQFVADMGAGVVVGIVALPLAIAFAIASGVTPERGIFTAIVAGFLISALGGSRVQIGGPTGAFVVIVYGIVQQYGTAGLTIATIMAGVILLVLGFAKLGGAIKFIPYPVTAGFTTGIAVIIFTSQIKDFLGLSMGDLPEGFIEKWIAYARGAGAVSLPAFGVALGSLILISAWPRVSRRIPAPFVAIVVSAVAVRLLDLPVDTIGSRFGHIPTSLPAPSIPSISLADATALVGPAFTIALLAAIESLLSAVVADGMIGGRHRSNMELVAQGVANIASPLFGGIPATGAIARTATNVRSGGRTPVAGMTHAVTLLLILFAFGRWAEAIPMPTLAAILVVVAYHMSEWRSFRNELRGPRSDVLVLLTTFVLTVLVDLTVAVQVGLVLAAFLFMRRMSEVTNVAEIGEGFADPVADTGTFSSREGPLPKGVQLYAIDGPFFFGAADKFREAFTQVSSAPRVLILVMRRVPAIDSTGLNALRNVIHRFQKDRTRVIIVGPRAQPRAAMERTGILEAIGAENVLPDLDSAIALADQWTAGPSSAP